VTWEAVLSAVLGVSVTLNVGLILRAKGLAELRHEFEKARTDDRHRSRAEWQLEVGGVEERITGIGGKVDRLSIAVRELIALQRPDLIKRIEL
jgi:hypothetical protein